MFAIQEGRTSQLKDMMILNEYSYIGRDRDGDNKGEHCAIYYKKDRFKVLKHGFLVFGNSGYTFLWLGSTLSSDLHLGIF